MVGSKIEEELKSEHKNWLKYCWSINRSLTWYSYWTLPVSSDINWSHEKLYALYGTLQTGKNCKSKLQDRSFY